MNKYIITADGSFYSQDELYHYGVPGMKWGKRKAKYETERTAYKQAKKDYKSASRELGLKSFTAFGRKGLRSYGSAEKKVQKAELAMIDAKAKYKAAKAKNADKAERAEFNTYRKAMQKSGLVGSAADTASGGRSKRMYNHLKVSKGKKYADAIEKRVEKQAYTQLAAGAAVLVGAAIVNGMIINNSI